MSNNNFQINTPENGWNDAPVIVVKKSAHNNVDGDLLLALVKDEPLLKDLVTALKEKTIDNVAIALIYNYLNTGSKTYYQKLVAGYFDQYKWIPSLKSVKIVKN